MANTISFNALSGNFEIVGGGSGSASSSFKTIQTPAGTSPVAVSATDILTLSSTGGTVTITGNSTTDTVNYDVVGSALTGLNATNIASGTLAAARLPNPSATTLGGVQSAAAVSNQWINSISTSGVPALSQPAFTNISGSVAASQMPALTGDVTTSAGAVATTVAAIQGVTISATPTPGQILMASSSSAASWVDLANISRVIVMHEDFMGSWNQSGFTGSNSLLSVHATGTASVATYNFGQSTAANLGIFELGTGTTATGSAYLDNSNGTNTSWMLLGGGYTVFETIVKLSALSNSTDRYYVNVGFSVGGFSATDGTSSDGIYFTYIDTQNSGNWTLVSSKASSSTKVDTTIAASASSFQRLTWVLNAAGTSIQGYVNGTAVGSAITTNIPVAAVRLLSGIFKTVGTSNSRSLYMDAIKYAFYLTTAR